MWPILAIASLAVMAIALAGLMVAEALRSRRLVWWTKPVASAAFVALPFAWGGLADAAGWLVVAGLVLAFLGDFCLIPASEAIFRVGIVLFLLAHVAYGAAFVVLGVDPTRFTGAALLVLVAGVLLARWFVPHVPRALKPAVVAYVLVISMMLALAVGAGYAVAVPALAFYLSDVTVARHRFVAPEPLNRLVGLPLYYGAQAGLAALAAGVLR